MCLFTLKSPNVYSNCYAAPKVKKGKVGTRLVKQEKKKEGREEKEKWKKRQSRGREGLKDKF